MDDQDTGAKMMKLDSTNYDMQKLLMMDMLYLKGLAEPIDLKGTKPGDKE